MRRASILGALIAMLWANASCGADVLFLEASDIEGAQTFLFAIEYEGALEVHAVGARSSTLNYGWAKDLPDGEGFQITRVAFGESLEELGWSEGPLAPSPAPNQRLEELAYLQIESAAITAGDSRGRLEPGGESEAVRSFLLPVTLDCPRFVDFELGPVRGPIEAVSVTASTAVILGVDEIVVVRRDQSFERVALPNGEVGRAITVSDRGRVWVATSTAIRALDPESGQFRPPEISVDASLRATGLFVRESSGTLEIWVLVDGGRFFRYESTTGVFEFAYAITPMRVRSDFLSLPARFAATESGGFIVASRLVSTVIEYRAGQPGSFTEAPVGGGFGGIDRRPDGSVIVLETSSGELWEHRGSEWMSLGRRASEVLAMAPLDSDRFLYVTRPGPLGILETDAGSCPQRPPPRTGFARALAALGTGFVFSGFTKEAREIFGWIELEPSN